MTDSFQRGEGRWQGVADVYDSQGRYAGQGRESRVVRRDLEGGAVEVDVSFEGPFSLSGTYRISNQEDHRRYEGPLNYGYAEAMGEDLVDANNYWPDLGLSQRLWLMVLPNGTTQLSLALLSRGEQTAYTVVGEYHRSLDGDGEGDAQDQAGQAGESPQAERAGESPQAERAGESPQAAHAGESPQAERAEESPQAERAEESPQAAHANHAGAEAAEEGLNSKTDADAAPLLRPGTWSGMLKMLDLYLGSVGQTSYSEHTTRDDQGRLIVATPDSDFASGAEIALSCDEQGLWSAPGDITGSASIWGGRALAGQFLYVKDGLRLWRREVVTRCGNLKGVLHTWYMGGSRVGTVYGTLEFTPSDPRP